MKRIVLGLAAAASMIPLAACTTTQETAAVDGPRSPDGYLYRAQPLTTEY